MKTHIIYNVIILILILAGFFGYKHMSGKNEQSEEKIIRSEEKIKFYEEHAKNQAYVTDSIHKDNIAMKAVIEYQKNNPKIIEKKYETILAGVLSLPDDDKVRFLSGRVSKKNSD